MKQSPFLLQAHPPASPPGQLSALRLGNRIWSKVGRMSKIWSPLPSSLHPPAPGASSRSKTFEPGAKAVIAQALDVAGAGAAARVGDRYLRAGGRAGQQRPERSLAALVVDGLPEGARVLEPINLGCLLVIMSGEKVQEKGYK